MVLNIDNLLLFSYFNIIMTLFDLAYTFLLILYNTNQSLNYMGENTQNSITIIKLLNKHPKTIKLTNSVSFAQLY